MRKRLVVRNLLEAGKAELYNLAKDPHEKTNLADKHPEKITALRKPLDAWWKPGK
jgi:uncharacterized sulfatase